MYQEDLLYYRKAKIHIFFKVITLSHERLIYAISIILITLMASAQCQPAAGDWFNEGKALANQSNYADAVIAFNKAVEINPQYIDAWLRKGEALYAQKKYSAAIEVFNRAIEIDPQDAEAWLNKGKTLYAMGTRESYKMAIEAFNKAIEIDRQNGETWFFKSKTLESLGDPKGKAAALAMAEEMGYTS